MITTHAAETNVAQRFSVLRGWCGLLCALSLIAIGQQLISALPRTLWPTVADTILQDQATTARFIVDVNRAPAEELAALPEVGAALAARIVEYRQSQGRFENVEGLLQVRGVGERTLQQLRPMIVAREP